MGEPLSLMPRWKSGQTQQLSARDTIKSTSPTFIFFWWNVNKEVNKAEGDQLVKIVAGPGPLEANRI